MKIEDKIDNWNKIGKNLLHQDQYEEALEMSENVLTVDPNNVVALEGKIDIYLYQKEYEKALSSSSRLMKLYEKYELVNELITNLQRIGYIHFLGKNLKEALVNYEKALLLCQKLELWEEKIILMYNIANLHYKLKNYNDAIMVYKKLKEIHIKEGPEEGVADDMVELARCFKKMSKPEKSIQYLRQAIEIYERVNPYSRTLTLYKLSKILCQQKEYLEAYNYVQKALSLLAHYKLKEEIEEDEKIYAKTKKLYEYLKENSDK